MRITASLVFGALLLACAPAFASGEASLLPEVKLSALFEDEKPPAVEKGLLEKGKPESLPRKWGVPGWWGYEKTKRATTAAFIPFYYRREEPETRIEHFWPFYGRKTKKYRYDTRYCLWPFFRYTRYESGATQVDMPWPFVQIYGGARTFHAHILPVLWVDLRPDDEGSVIVFPVFWHMAEGKSRSTVFFPVYWDVKTPELELWHLWPVYGYSKVPGRRRLMVGFPLFRYTERWDPAEPEKGQPVDRQFDLAWPFVKMRLGPLHKQFHLFPFYYGKTYYRDKEDGKTKLDSRYVALAPVFWYGKDRQATYFNLWPYCIHKTHDGGQKKINIAFPLLYIHKRKPLGLTEISIPAPFLKGLTVFWYASGPANIVLNNPKLKGKGTYISLFPLFRYRSAHDAEAVEISGPAIISIFKYTKKKTIVHFADHSVMGHSVDCQLFPLFAYHSKPDLLHIIINPILSYRRVLSSVKEKIVRLYVGAGLLSTYFADAEGYDFRILMGLFGLGRKQEDSYVRLLWFLKL